MSEQPKKPRKEKPRVPVFQRVDLITFNVEESERLKDEGIATACAYRDELLKLARTLAIRAARKQNGTVHIDDVQAELTALGYCSADLGKAAGGVFTTNDFIWTGIYHNSSRISSHAHPAKVWKLKSDQP